VRGVVLRMTALDEAGRRQTQLQQIPRRAFSRTRNCWQPTTTVTDSAPRRVSCRGYRVGLARWRDGPEPSITPCARWGARFSAV